MFCVPFYLRCVFLYSESAITQSGGTVELAGKYEDNKNIKLILKEEDKRVRAMYLAQHRSQCRVTQKSGNFELAVRLLAF